MPENPPPPVRVLVVGTMIPRMRARLILGTFLVVVAAALSQVHEQRSSKPDISSQLSLLGLRLEKSTFADIQEKLGVTEVGQCSHDVEPVAYIGYVSQNKSTTRILFESSRFDPPYELSGFKVVAGSVATSPCHLRYRTSGAFGSEVQTDGGLKLGLNKTELTTSLGSPNKASLNRLTFEWWSTRPMTKVEVDRKLKHLKLR
jgi:hypothetical protein